jgi:hypothetical protein
MSEAKQSALKKATTASVAEFNDQTRQAELSGADAGNSASKVGG